MNQSFDIFCGKCWEPFSPFDTAIGGSEKAVIKMAEELAKAGASVRVFSEWEGDHQGAQWIHFTKYQPTGADVLVNWRGIHIPNPVGYKQSWMWLHDLMAGPLPEKAGDSLDRILVLSEFHRGNVLKCAPWAEFKVFKTANGFEIEHYPAEFPNKIPHHYIYSSSPRRGLGTLLRDWPAVRKQFPSATLHVCYGFDLSIQMCETVGDKFTANVFRRLQVQANSTPGVINHGRVGQPDLANLQRQCVAWLYPPSDFEETFCITALEAQAAYCLPISRDNGALPEVVQNRFIWSHENHTSHMLDMLSDIPYIEWLEDNRQWAAQHTWAAVAKQWMEQF